MAECIEKDSSLTTETHRFETDMMQALYTYLDFCLFVPACCCCSVVGFGLMDSGEDNKLPGLLGGAFAERSFLPGDVPP